MIRKTLTPLNGNPALAILASLTMFVVIFGVSDEGFSQDDSTPEPQTPAVEMASNEGEEAIGQFQYPDHLKCELFAAEPMVANIVAIHRDYQGRLFVAESYRQEKGIEDNRSHGHWMDEELAAKTVQDRIDYIHKYIPGADTKYTAQDDRIRVLRDANGDGRASWSKIFADHFNRLEMGTGAGVLSYRDSVYYTCIPDLFVLRDKTGDGVADERKSLHTGFGVRFAFRGHDMHGLIVGPDGRLYFSIGDRGYNVSPSVNDPTSGAVFRCELDGSGLEVVATGLRNPQELAFDDYGNLFTGDNNSDSGDKARFTEIVEGGDSGWRMYYQYLPDRGPFNREKIWHPLNEDTPAYIIPPIANITDGPSGLEYYPGTGFGDDFNGRFFLCDFRGAAPQSGIRSFRCVPQGASWKIEQDEQPFWKMLITDIDFGTDGKLYASDWVFGWEGVNKGRVYTFFDPKHINSPIVREVETLLRLGLTGLDVSALEQLLGHLDRRVRQEAQFELAKRNEIDTLRQVAVDPNRPQLARIHAIWGLGQLLNTSRKIKANRSFVAGLIEDSDWHVVVAAAKLAGEIGYDHPEKIAALLTHENLRVRFQAAMTLGKIGTDADVPAIAQMLVENADRDAMLRHGGIMAFDGIFQRSPFPVQSAVALLSGHESASVRIAVVVAMRKLLMPNRPGNYRARRVAATLVSGLLGDSDPQVVLEAARVIHDVPVDSEMVKLADLISTVNRFSEMDPLVRRIVSANLRVGAQENADALAEFAANDGQLPSRRVDAVDALSQWASPPARDRVLNDWRPLDPRQRNVTDARNALESKFVALTNGFESLSGAAIKAAGDLNLTAIEGDLEVVVLSPSAKDSTRNTALISLGKLKFERMDAILESLSSEEHFAALPPMLKGTVVALIGTSNEPKALTLIEKVMESGELSTKQSVLDSLGQMRSLKSAAVLDSFFRKVVADDFPASLRLDLTLAAENRKQQSVRESLAAYRKKLANDNDPLALFVDTLEGGNADAGSRIFLGKTEVSCIRCHKVDQTGGDVGPVLTGIGKKKDRKYLLEAIVTPNKSISEGFAQTKVLTEDGKLHVGLVTKETDEALFMLDADGKEMVIEKDMIDSTSPGKSSMPDDLVKSLSKKEIRDLIEFLSER